VSTVTCLCVCHAGRAAMFSVLALQFPPPVSDARCVPRVAGWRASVGPICVMSWRGRSLAALCRRRSAGRVGDGCRAELFDEARHVGLG
jgi:hypothetical protein